MNDSSNAKLKANIIQIVVNIISGLSVFYYLLLLDQPFIEDNFFNVIILTIFIVKFVVDIFTFKTGLASFSLVLLFLPIISLLGFAPIKEVQPLFNNQTLLIEEHFNILAFSALFFYYTWSLLLHVGKKTFREYDLEVLKYLTSSSTSLLSTWFFSAVSVISVIIYLPDLPGGSYTATSNSLLPGNAWNAVVAISYFFVIIGSKDSKFRTFALIFVPFWLLTHFARVDILGLILIIYLIIANTKKGELFKQKLNFKKVAFITIGVLLFSYLGLVRHSGLIFDATAITEAIINLINYPTVQDIIYSTAAAIEVTHNSGTYHTLINYIPQLIPSFFGTAGEGAAYIVANQIHTNYGLLIYGEYYMNYKIIGVIAAPFVTYVIVFLPAGLLRAFFGKFGFAIGYYLIVTAMPRIFWYGYIYYLKPLVIIVPIFIIVHLIIVNIEKELAGKPVLKNR
ncbi:hypothetical protein [Planococcus salinarum]|uniref:hypothetical protein n=1 Tax=Planococcus salinarum TaxID=622695 RepID=UPI000E3E82B6|nr:hypothetical protein [Planococcus salinarum]TAA72297.1 hypothetical protein D2909_06930 [Planococcus salinarum]